jgi:hypothetical protein
MGILNKIFNVGETAVAPITAIGNVLDGLFTSKDEVLTHEAILTRLAQQPNLAQVELNKVEASHRSVFVAGWRPAIGWVAAASLFFFYVPQYVVATIVWIKLLVANDWVMVPYPVGVDGVMELVIALLGMGALRTVDKAAKRTK